MATLKDTIKSWFETDDTPTQAQFWAWLDSFWHKDEKIPITAIDDIEGILDAKADAEALTNHINSKGERAGYAPLDELAKIPLEYLPEMEPTPQHLQSVLDAGKTAFVDGTNCRIGILEDDGEGNLIFEVVTDNSEATKRATFYLDSAGNFGIGTSDDLDNNGSALSMSQGIFEFLQRNGLNQTHLSFEPQPEIPGQDPALGPNRTFLKFPAKPEGTYTLATIDDISSGGGSLQDLVNQSATIDGEFGSLIQLLTGTAFNRNIRLETYEGNASEYKRRGLLLVTNTLTTLYGYRHYTGGGKFTIDNGAAKIVQMHEYEGDEWTTTLNFENPTIANTTVSIPAPVLSGAYKVGVIKATAPPSATDAGVVGEIRYDSNYVYFCVATDTWKRAALATW